MRSLSDPCIHWQDYAAGDMPLDFSSAALSVLGKPVAVEMIDPAGGTVVVRTAAVPGSDTSWAMLAGSRRECRITQVVSTTASSIAVGFSDAS